MTEAQYLAWIRSALRSKWLRWPPRAESLKAAQVPYVGDNPRRKYSYKCALCQGLFTASEVEVDHFPEDAGSIVSVDDVGPFVNRLYCEVNNLRVVCKQCHAVHTLSRKLGISFEAALIEKKVIAFEKEGKDKVVAFCKKQGYTDSQLSNPEKRRAALKAIFIKEE